MLDAAQLLLPLLGLVPLAVPAKARARRPTRAAGATRKAGASAAPPATPGTCFDAAELRAVRRVYLGLASRWELSGHEALVLLGEPEGSEEERRERLHGLVRVTRLLQLVHPEPDRARGFLREPHPAFGDAAPLALMLAEGCPAIAQVREHLLKQAGC